MVLNTEKKREGAGRGGGGDVETVLGGKGILSLLINSRRPHHNRNITKDNLAFGVEK